MKLALGVFNSKYVHSSLAPWCLAAAVEQRAPETDCRVLEGTINQPPEKLADAMAALDPDAAGFSVYIWNRKATFAAVRRLRQLRPECLILLGGPEVSYCAAQMLKALPEADYILAGEGEESLPAFCRMLQEGKRPGRGELPGLCGRDEKGIYQSEPAVLTGPAPSPYTDACLQALGGRIAYIETSRGCPYRCAFCLSGRCGPVRLLDLEEAKNRILLLAASGARTIKFVDRTFNASPARAEALWAWMLAEYGRGIPAGVRLHFEIAGDILTPRQLELLSAFPDGAVQLEIGLQSFHEPTLAAIHRRTDCRKLAQNIRLLAKKGNLHLHIDLIAGLPLEDYDTFGRSFDTAFSLRPQMLQLGFLKLLPGADMREYPEEYPCRYRPEPPYEVIDTPWITAAQLDDLRGVEDAVERLYNSGRFLFTVEYLLTATGWRPFVLFEALAQSPAAPGMSLDDYTALVQTAAQSLPGVEPEKLRDALCLDRLAFESGGRLPRCLQRPDKALKGCRLRLEQKYPRPAGARRGTALLYGSGQLAWVDCWQPPHPVTGRRPVHRASLAQVESWAAAPGLPIEKGDTE